jgi:hypothetical protein
LESRGNGALIKSLCEAKGAKLTTEHHAKLFAHELTRQRSVADSEKLADALMDAQVDLNPHQVEAALFAFKSPLSKAVPLESEETTGVWLEIEHVHAVRGVAINRPTALRSDRRLIRGSCQ